MVDIGADVGLLAIARAGRLLDRVRHRVDHDLLVDRLLARDRVGDLQQFQPVGADNHLFVSLNLARRSAPFLVLGFRSVGGLSAPPFTFFACLRAWLSLDSASRIRSSLKTSRASAIVS